MTRKRSSSEQQPEADVLARLREQNHKADLLAAHPVGLG